MNDEHWYHRRHLRWRFFDFTHDPKVGSRKWVQVECKHCLGSVTVLLDWWIDNSKTYRCECRTSRSIQPLLVYGHYWSEAYDPIDRALLAVERDRVNHGER